VGPVEGVGPPAIGSPEPPGEDMPPPEPDGPGAEPPFALAADWLIPRFESARPDEGFDAELDPAFGSSRAEPAPTSRIRGSLKVPPAGSGAADDCDGEPIESTASSTLRNPKPCTEERIVKRTKAVIAAAFTSAAETAAAK
jgi:hypothetical protein